MVGGPAHGPGAGAAAPRPRGGHGAVGPLCRGVAPGLRPGPSENPGADGTSRLSPYLHFGCVHPRTVLAAAGTGAGPDRLRTELAWRDFYADVLWHQPCSAHRPLQEFGRHLRWDDDARSRERFRAWATGRTGFPLVDAAMRQLLAEGWVHNRARMVAASFLVKDLHIDWRLGARWFLWHLVDGDLASNQHGWQWVAGTGTDAAPFHRIFNPGTQMERFDPEGTYVRRYLDEGTGPAPSLAGPSLPGARLPRPGRRPRPGKAGGAGPLRPGPPGGPGYPVSLRTPHTSVAQARAWR